MEQNSERKKPSSTANNQKWLPTWFKVCVVILIALIVLKVSGLQVFIEIDYDGKPFLAGLTELKTYLIPLGLLLIYILSAWLWHKFFGSKDS